MKIVDAHCHLNDEMYKEDLDEIIKEVNAEMEFIVCSGWDFDSSMSAIKLANENDKIYASIGFHPTDISKMTEEKLLILENLAKENDKIVGIGEIGLDYHWMVDPKEVQIAGLKKQIEMIRRVNKPIIIHTREALEDTINILREYEDVGGLLHCFPGSYESVQPIINRYFVNVGGTLTFKNNRKTKELVDKLDIEKIVLETDSPYLTPTPFRGKRNKPTMVKYVAEEVARIKNMSVEDVINVTTSNAIRALKMEKLLCK